MRDMMDDPTRQTSAPAPPADPVSSWTGDMPTDTGQSAPSPAPPAAAQPVYPRVWLFDINRRVYQRDASGRAFGSPIWREHWEEQVIVGETRVSWVTEWGKKVPKKGGWGIAFSEEEIAREAFVQDHRRNIVR